ncbi:MULTISPECIES: methanogen output domain 1-containing protein [unclassified Thermosynechococcus]|jgi:predicted ArsR family transcriptional regulator|uniref:methanogen output domain 1-containing protein n=1 Tax=unclassified Thermosynechococcus TaxID=2622553 RepID=UPI00059BE484|nr:MULTISPECIES: methanogen output domain 1-containing protein [unclassified Thermosynechococcus]HIK23556.1 transcriptional regulator [Thermosynechococcus sp. M3746_W2019_013]
MTAKEMFRAEAYTNVGNLPIDLQSSSFLQHLLGLVAETLEDIVGLDDASGFIALVGQQMGNHINELYTQALGDRPLDAKTVAQILVDLKNRIEGGFFLIEQDEERIILGNQRCPLGSGVIGHPSLCMMTSSVFGVIVAHHLGYAKVCIEAAIANGDQGCRVVIYTQPTAAAAAAKGREYYPIESH